MANHIHFHSSFTNSGMSPCGPIKSSPWEFEIFFPLVLAFTFSQGQLKSGLGEGGVTCSKGPWFWIAPAAATGTQQPPVCRANALPSELHVRPRLRFTLLVSDIMEKLLKPKNKKLLDVSDTCNRPRTVLVWLVIHYNSSEIMQHRHFGMKLLLLLQSSVFKVSHTLRLLPKATLILVTVQMQLYVCYSSC